MFKSVLVDHKRHFSAHTIKYHISTTVFPHKRPYRSDFGIFHQMVPLRKFYSVTLSYYLKVDNLIFYISETARVSEKMHRMTFIDLDICQRMIPLRNLHLMTMAYFFRIKRFASTCTAFSVELLLLEFVKELL